MCICISPFISARGDEKDQVSHAQYTFAEIIGHFEDSLLFVYSGPTSVLRVP